MPGSVIILAGFFGLTVIVGLWVMGYNNALQVFPANMVAGMFGFTEAIFFEVEGLGDVGKAVVTADQKKDLDISFDDM